MSQFAISCRAPVVDVSISPNGSMELLSQLEVERLRNIGHGDVSHL